MARRRTEPLLWLAFSVGGVLTALLVPVLLFLFGLALPLGWVRPPDHPHLISLLNAPLTRAALLGLCVLALLHAAHRLQFVLRDLLRISRSRYLAAACYASALAGALAAGAVLFGG